MSRSARLESTYRPVLEERLGMQVESTLEEPRSAGDVAKAPLANAHASRACRARWWGWRCCARTASGPKRAAVVWSARADALKPPARGPDLAGASVLHREVARAGVHQLLPGPAPRAHVLPAAAKTTAVAALRHNGARNAEGRLGRGAARPRVPCGQRAAFGRGVGVGRGVGPCRGIVSRAGLTPGCGILTIAGHNGTGFIGDYATRSAPGEGRSQDCCRQHSVHQAHALGVRIGYRLQRYLRPGSKQAASPPIRRNGSSRGPRGAGELRLLLARGRASHESRQPRTIWLHKHAHHFAHHLGDTTWTPRYPRCHDFLGKRTAPYLSETPVVTLTR